MKLKVFSVAPLEALPTHAVDCPEPLKFKVAAYQELAALVRSMGRVERGNHVEFVPVEVRVESA